MSERCHLRGQQTYRPQDITTDVAPLCDPGDGATNSTTRLTGNNGWLSTIHSPYSYCYQKFNFKQEEVGKALQ